MDAKLAGEIAEYCGLMAGRPRQMGLIMEMGANLAPKVIPELDKALTRVEKLEADNARLRAALDKAAEWAYNNSSDCPADLEEGLYCPRSTNKLTGVVQEFPCPLIPEEKKDARCPLQYVPQKDKLNCWLGAFGLTEESK